MVRTAGLQLQFINSLINNHSGLPFSISFVAEFVARIADGSPGWDVGITSRFVDLCEKIADGNPHKLPRMVPTRDWASPLFPIHPSMTATVINHDRNRDRGASTAATGRGNDPSIPGSLCGRARGCFGGPVGGPGTCERGGQQSTR
jgi:hypothetical protein